MQVDPIPVEIKTSAYKLGMTRMKTFKKILVLPLIFALIFPTIPAYGDTSANQNVNNKNDVSGWFSNFDEMLSYSFRDFIPVSNITFTAPKTTTAGVPLQLTGTVAPTNATGQVITWSVKDAGTTGATIDKNGVLNTNVAGTAVVTATILNGAVDGHIETVSAGGYYTMGLKTDGSLWAWGDNSYGQLGSGNTVGSTIPVQIGGDFDWAAVSAGDTHTVALKTDGSLWAWGDNSCGQLGNGNNVSSTIPVRIDSDFDWVAVSAGGFHTIALKEDGSLWAWGDNSDGQLGRGNTTNSIIPVRIGNDTSWVAISAGLGYTLALKENGSLWAWGDNSDGQLGRGDTANNASPVRIGSDTDWTAVVAGSWHSVALKQNGSLWAWGSNFFGQLGDNTDIDKSSPVQISGYNDWVAVSVGEWHTVAVKEDGSLWAWGNHSWGQLGIGYPIDDEYWYSPIPVQVGTGFDPTAVSAGIEHNVTLKTDGSLWAWGGNLFGQVGNNTEEEIYSPVEVMPPAEILDYSQDFAITVNAVTLTGIAVTAKPANTSYYMGQELNLSGLAVTATYSDGSTKAVTGYTANPAAGYIFNTAGTQTITVSYTEGNVTKTAVFTVTVNAVTLTGIAVTTKPANTSYYVGQGLNLSGLAVTATYDDGSTKAVTGYTVNPAAGYIFNTAGTRIIMVNYTEGDVTKTAVFTVTVSAGTFEEITPPVIRISRFTLVSTARSGLSNFDYKIRATVENFGGEAKNVRVILVDVGNQPNVTRIGDGITNFGDISAGATKTSEDTFTVRIDRTGVFDSSQLKFIVYYDE